jgi:hypothetical protein
MTTRYFILLVVAAFFFIVGGDDLQEINCKGKTNKRFHYRNNVLTLKVRF